MRNFSLKMGAKGTPPCPPVSQGEPSRPQNSEASAPTSEESTSPPLYSPTYTKLATEKKLSEAYLEQSFISPHHSCPPSPEGSSSQ